MLQFLFLTSCYITLPVSMATVADVLECHEWGRKV